MNDKVPLNEQLLSQVTRSQSLKKWLRWAIIVHVVVILVGTIGMPHWRKKPFDMSRAVSVDLVAPTGDISAAPNKTKVAQPPKPQVKPEDKPKEVKTDNAKPPSPVKSDAAKKETVTKPDEKKLDKPKEKVEKPKKEATKPAEKKVDLEKKKKPSKDDGASTEEEQQEFNSVLKNLLGDPETPTGNPVDAPVDEKAEVIGSAPTSSEVLSLSEMDALKYQLARCWNVPSGAMNAEDLIVDIRVQVNPDRTVQTAEIVDQGRYRADSFFAAAADSARRAMFNPLCTPLALPPEKYDLWKDLLIRFNPRDMFGG